MSGLLDAARRYAELGYPVFPCLPGRKNPLTPNGFRNATTSSEQIEAWWQRWPNANVASPTTGLVVVDVDGPDNQWLVDQPERLMELATGCVALTPGGGRHYYFRQPAGESIRCQTGLLAPHVDIRAEGGYVLAPPSIVGGKIYQWVVGMELEQPADRLPELPTWLLEQIQQTGTRDDSPASEVGEVSANPIPTGQRNATLARLAGTMRRVGMTVREIASALNQINQDRCYPPLSPAEVERIASSVSRYAPDQVAVAITEDHYQQDFAEPKQSGELSYAAITSKQLDENEYELEYLINGILVRGQPGVIAGPKKTLKTNLSIDLALSLSSGGRFLNHFAADREVRVGVMSGESGAATIQETARRIAKAKDQRLKDFAKVIWSFTVPQLGDITHTEALHRFITTHELDVLILDPTYLMMLNLGDNAGNLFIVGSFLKSLGDIAQATGCTPLLCHHLKKGIADPYEPAELENIAWAGFQEFVRQWILLNRRVRYDPDKGGHHELWMSVGGSAGHSGLWGLNVEEGTRQDVSGRHWQVEVMSAAEAYAQRDAEAEYSHEVQKQREKNGKLQQRRDAVLQMLAKFPAGETPRTIRELAGIGASSIQSVLDALVADGEIIACNVQKNKREELGYRLANVGGPGGPCWSGAPRTSGCAGGGPAYI